MLETATPFVSGIVILNYKRSRFTLPAKVLKSAGWSDLDDVEVLIAEFLDVGHYLLHRQSSIIEVISCDKEQIITQSRNPRQKDVSLQALADQFREVTFYRKSNNRICVKEEFMMALTEETQNEKDIRLYLQAGTNSIDVMTHAVRIAKLKAFIESGID